MDLLQLARQQSHSMSNVSLAGLGTPDKTTRSEETLTAGTSSPVNIFLLLDQ